jgi:hypothetical protein
MGRLLITLPFRRTAVMEELLVRCCLPRVREHCRQHGWSLLAICISDELDPDLHNTRTDTLPLCRVELDRCIRLSGGPSMLALLDRTTSLVGTLPPDSIPAAEYDKLLTYFHQAPSLAVRASGVAPTSVEEERAQRSKVPSAVALMRRWYRPAPQSRTQGTAGVKTEGDYCLATPADLLHQDVSVFSPQASADRVPDLQVRVLVRAFKMRCSHMHDSIRACASACASKGKPSQPARPKPQMNLLHPISPPPDRPPSIRPTLPVPALSAFPFPHPPLPPSLALPTPPSFPPSLLPSFPPSLLPSLALAAHALCSKGISAVGSLLVARCAPCALAGLHRRAHSASARYRARCAHWASDRRG